MSDDTEFENPSQEEIENEARQMGWAPKDKFKGREEDWVDAAEFVERGRKIMPILLQNNKRLKDQLANATARIGTLEAGLRNTEIALQKLEKHYTKANKRLAEEAKANLKAHLKKAREDNDIDAEIEIQDKLRELDSAIKDEPAPDVKDKKTSDSGSDDGKPKLSPEFRQWQEENPWFGGTSREDILKTRRIERIAQDLRDDETDLVGREFLDECVRIYEERYGDGEDTTSRPKTRQSKVETPSSRGGGNSRSFSSLPREAKQACHEDADDLVGEGKRYKTLKEWEDAYAKIYYSEENAS